MKGRQHPVLVVLIVLGSAVLVLAVVMTAIFALAGRVGGLSLKDRIGVIPIEGTIIQSETVVSQLVEFKKDRRVKAIILRVNSPGGGVAPSQEIHREVLKTKENKRIIASMGTVAASGGYYVASGADRIVASPGTLTGSIGVLMEFVRFQELMEKIGVDVEILKSGEFKDLGSPHRKLTEQEKEMIQALVFDIQSQFVEAVAQGRNLPLETVRDIADGRIVSGSQGLELGLVDQLGNFQDAVELAKSMAGITGEATLVYPKKTRARLWEILAQDASSALYRILRHATGMQINYRWDGLSYY